MQGQNLGLIISHPSLLLSVFPISLPLVLFSASSTLTLNPPELLHNCEYFQTTHYNSIHFQLKTLYFHPSSETGNFLSDLLSSRSFFSPSPCVIFSCVYISISAAVICFRMTVFNGAAFPFHRGHMWRWDVEEGWGRGSTLGGWGYQVGEAVQREWQRHSAASPVTLNNAARMGKEQPSSSLNGRRRLYAPGCHRA